MLQNKIPLTVLIATKNEEHHIATCLQYLQQFDEIIVIDSHSTDQTCAIAAQHGAQICNFIWNGQYPKKRQWILDNIPTKHNWVLFIDADEYMTPDLVNELKNLDLAQSTYGGYFIKARYIWNGQPLRFGLNNNKLCLLDKSKMEFPHINDLNAPGMGEIEGHYQPVLMPAHTGSKIGKLHSALLHNACTDPQQWLEKHKRYAAWEHYMNINKAWPRENATHRSLLKALFRALPLRPQWAYIHSAILKGGLLDGAQGHAFALARMRYYQMIRDLKKRS